MNNQDLLYNISLNARETEDVMNALADKANLLSSLQKKIYGQAIQQKQAFDSYINEKREEEAVGEPTVEVNEEPTPEKKNKKKEVKE